MSEAEDTIRTFYEDIRKGSEVRKNLIDLRGELKDEAGRKTLAALLDSDFSVFSELLDSKDAKIRKNAALVLGSVGSEDLLPVLFEAYLKEETLYIRADYLKALSKMDYRPLEKELEDQLEKLRSTDWTKEEWKHVSEEIRILQEMVLHCRGVRQHRFAPDKAKENVILMTNRRFRELTASQVQKGKITMLAGGLRVDGALLKEIMQIRTFSEILFPIDTGELKVSDPVFCGQILALPVLAIADRLLKGAGSFLFRVEIRLGKEKINAPFNSENKGSYIRKISDAIERESSARLINSVSEYELEIRLVLRSDSTYTAMVKLSPSFDGRFFYRREIVANSIAPVNAALIANLCKPWLKPGAQVLDPFCGVGTMLIERDRTVKAGDMYGVDIFSEAVEKARRNTRRAGCHINYVNRDFFTFRHDYPFDEIITDMPVKTKDGTKKELRNLYHAFFERVPSLLKDEAVLFLYTFDPNYVVESCRAVKGYQILQSFLLNEKNGTTLFVLSYQRNNG